MRARWMRALPILVLVSLLVLATAAASAATLTLMHFNDAYDLPPVDKELGGFDRLATVIAGIRAEDPNALLLFPGDLISPSVSSSVFKGAQMIAGMNLLRADFATFGNHEFDFGDEVLQQRLAESAFTWLASNVLYQGRQYPNTQPYALVQAGEVTVGLLGLVTPESSILSSPGDDTVIFVPIEAARAYAPMLRRLGAEVIVAITHLTVAQDKALLAAVPEIDIVLGGHEHEVIVERVGHRLISKAGSDARYLGVTTVEVEDGWMVSADTTTIPVTREIEPDPAMAFLIADYQSQLDSALGMAIGETRVVLDANRSEVRRKESLLGNLIADALRAFSGADVAITNGGGIRSDTTYGPGVLTRRDVLAWLPFGNRLVTARVTGEQIWAALENGVSQWEQGAGRFPQVSGLRFAFDASRPAGQRVLWVEVGGQTLDPDATYVLATNDYMLGGGDGYSALTGAQVLVDPSGGRLLDEVVAQYIQANSPVAPAIEGRIIQQGQ